MDKNILEELLPKASENEMVGTSANGKIDRTGIVFHVTTHSFNDEKIFNFDTAQYRENLLMSLSRKTGIRVIFSAVQPTHTHDVIMCKTVEDIMKTFKVLNGKVSHYVKLKNPKHYSIAGVRVFRDRPSYQVVESFSHFLFLSKYLFDNGEELRKQNKRPPYCCFDELERGFFNNYPKEIYSKLFKLEIEEIIEKCKTLNKKEFLDFCNEKYKAIDKGMEKHFFHK